MTKLFKALICAVLAIGIATQAKAEVYWEFQIGAMGHSTDELPGKLRDFRGNDAWEDKILPYNAQVGLNLFIPVSRRIPLLIETGVHFKVTPFQLYEHKFDEYSSGNPSGYDYYISQTNRFNYSNLNEFPGIQIPLKINYEWRWSNWNSLRFGLGIYGRYMFFDDELSYHYKESFETRTFPNRDMYAPVNFYHSNTDCYYMESNDHWQMGFTPSVVYSHRCVSFGVSYEMPLIKGETFKNNRFNNQLTFTFSLKFNTGAWEKIGSGLTTAAMVAGAVSEAYMETQGNSYYSSGSSESSYGSYSAGSSSSGSSASSASSGNGFSIQEQQAYNNDKRTYERYDSMLASYFAGNSSASSSDKREWQRKMKQLREKWEKRGKSFPHSSNENR